MSLQEVGVFEEVILQGGENYGHPEIRPDQSNELVHNYYVQSTLLILTLWLVTILVRPQFFTGSFPSVSVALTLTTIG